MTSLLHIRPVTANDAGLEPLHRAARHFAGFYEQLRRLPDDVTLYGRRYRSECVRNVVNEGHSDQVVLVAENSAYSRDIYGWCDRTVLVIVKPYHGDVPRSVPKHLFGLNSF